MSLEQVLARQAKLAMSISNSNSNLRKLGQENYTRSVLTMRINVVEKNWKEFNDNDLVLCNPRSEDDENHEYFTSNVYSTTETKYLEALSYHYMCLDQLPPPEALVGAPTTSTMPLRAPRTPKLELRKFSGKLADWAEFKDQFVALVSTNPALTNVDRISHLKNCMTGEASDLLSGIASVGEKFQEAWEILTTRYENKRLVASVHLNAFSTLKPVIADSHKALRQLIVETTNFRKVLSKQGEFIDQRDALIVHFTIQKLDSATRREWEKLIGGKTEYPSFAELETFIYAHANTLEALRPTQSSSYEKKQSFDSRSTKQSHHAAKIREVICTLCSGKHFIMFCPQFTEKTLEQRKEIITKKKLCVQCLGSHSIQDCRSIYKCRLCSSAKHHTLLHPLNKGNSTSNQETASTSHTAVISSVNIEPRTLVHAVAAQHAQQSSGTVLLATALVHVHDHQGQRHIARALIDQGSEISFVSEALAKKLKLKKTNEKESINGVGGIECAKSKGRTVIRVSSQLDPKFSQTIDALILPTVTAYKPSVQTVHADWTHLWSIHLADSFQTKPIEMLLGADLYATIIREGIRRGPPGTPLAQNTALGWILSGPIGYTPKGESSTVTTSHAYLKKSHQDGWLPPPSQRGQLRRISTIATRRANVQESTLSWRAR